MDKERIIAELNDALDKLRSDIDTEIHRPVLHMRGDDWKQSPKVQDDCHYIYEELNKALNTLGMIRGSVKDTEEAIGAMYRQWQRTKAVAVPSTISDYVRSVVDEFLAGKAEFLLVEEVLKKVEAQKTIYAKNKAAVVASFLGRDGRLQRVGKGKFTRRLVTTG